MHLFDAHLHLRDPRLEPYHWRFVKEALDAGVTSCIDCATRPEEWAVEVACDLRVSTAYGLHPWYVSVAPPNWLEQLECALKHDPSTLLGEVGLDGLRKVFDGGAAQRAALQAQLRLAAQLQRPVVLHGARAWGALLHEVEPWGARIPAWMLHGVSFSADLLNHPFMRRSNVWFSVGGGLLARGAQALPRLASEIPLNRLLIETDSPDMFPCGGEPLVLGQWHTLLNHPGNLRLILEKLAELRDIPPDELAGQTLSNTCDFLSARTTSRG